MICHPKSSDNAGTAKGGAGTAEKVTRKATTKACEGVQKEKQPQNSNSSHNNKNSISNLTQIWRWIKCLPLVPHHKEE